MEADIVSSDNGQRKLRGGIQQVRISDIPTAENDPYPAARARVFASRQANEEYDQAILIEGGDEAQFDTINTADISELEPVEYSASGVLLSTGIHRISGPPGGGKTRFAYWEIIQRVKAGEYWAVYDQEMGPERYKQTMLQLGATEEDLSNIDYVTTKSGVVPNLVRHGRAFVRFLNKRHVDGILYDSQTVFLGACGISENDAQGVRNWTVSACSGIGCAIIIDHVGHANDEHGRGSSDKAAGCDIDLILKVDMPFAMGLHGSIVMKVNKDRSGTIPSGSEIIVNVMCNSDDDGMVFSPASWGVADYSDPLTVAEHLSLLLMRTGRDYAIARELQAELKGMKQDRIAKIREAVENGEIKEKIVGNAHRYFEV
jgi:hypothetical protein